MKVEFITREGIQQPGARIRCYGFASQLKARGVYAAVFSFVDDLGAKAGKDEKGFNAIQRFTLILKAFKPLRSKKNYLFVVNRFNYHALSTWFLSFIKGVPYVFDMDDWEARQDLGYYFGFFPKSKAEFFTRIFSRKSRFCIAASHYLQDYLSRFNQKVYYIPTGVDLKEFRPQNTTKNKDKVIFSWHGSINRIKTLDDLDFMIDCFVAVNNKYPSCELWIKGSGMFIDEFTKLLTKYKNNNIKYIGWSSPETIPSYLDNVDVGLYPMLEGSRFNLAKSPTKVFEYMAMKIPVVASKIGEVEHIIGHAKTGFLAKDRDEFITFMETLVKYPDLRHRLGENARLSIEGNYSLDVLGERLYRIFSDNFNLDEYKNKRICLKSQ